MPKKHGRSEKYTHFVDLSRKKRGTMALAIRRACAQLAPLLGGRYLCSYWRDFPRLPEEGCQWVDCFFPGLDKFTFWNVEILTARAAFHDLVQKLAGKRADALLPEEVLHNLFTFEDRVGTDGRIDPLGYNDSPFPELGGLDYHSFVQQAAREIAANEPPAVYEEFSVHTDYAYGIGLHIIIDAECITRDVIEQTLDRFTALGQKAWKSPTPVPAEHLQGVEFPWLQAMVGKISNEDIFNED